MTGASEQLRSIVDRILRLKAEQDDLALDIREVYADAKRNSFDKTALGQLVSYIRKRDKDPEKFAEGSAVFDLYLSAYENGDVSVNRPEKINDFSCAHTHEASLETIPASQTPKGDGGRPYPSTDPEAQKAGAARLPVEQGGESHNMHAGQSGQPADIPPLPAFLRRDKQARAV